ncbi:MAG: hypothetical protein IJG15_06395 [Lachnospiraceae bacterium]|nr:hypothetical protein [Lachnospiraceae bacterium]
MDKDISITWFEMPVSMQISNIGSEVSRAISWKKKGNEKRMIGFCNKAIEFLKLSIEDPKNKHRIGEFSFCIEELEDYFIGDNIYGTTDEMLHKYYDAFI